MKAVEAVKLALGMSQDWVMGLVTDMKDAPLTFPTPSGGNHPLWVLGHLVYSEGELVDGLIKKQPNPVEQWKDLFGGGSQPSADASKYPSMDELLAKFEQVRGQTLAYVDTLSDEDLDKPTGAEMEMFSTVGKCLLAVAVHFTFHGGEVADARRAAGRKPLLG